MSVVAWDGRTISADKRATSHGTFTITKSKQLEDKTVLAWVGTHDQGLALSAWYEAGQSIAEYPKCQETDEWTSLIVVTPDGICKSYNQLPYPIIVEDNFFAWGSGAAYATAAMHLGSTTEDAVNVAMIFDSSCGNGINTYILEQK